MNRNYCKCEDYYINSIYNKVGNYIKAAYNLNKLPDLYLNKSKSIHLLGLYQWDKEGHHIILNSEIVNHRGEVLNTLIHELCHYVSNIIYKCNCHHDYRWKKIAQEVGNYFGEVIHIYCSGSETLKSCKQIKNGRKISNYKYIVKCECCGHIFTYKKRTEWINKILNNKPVNYLSCPHCKGHNFSANVEVY